MIKSADNFEKIPNIKKPDVIKPGLIRSCFTLNSENNLKLYRVFENG